MKIAGIEAFPISLERDRAAATGTAGSPTTLVAGAGSLRWSSTVPTVYSERFETTLVRVTLADGRMGWGEAQAPVAPRVSAAIVTDILAHALADEEFDGTRANIEHLWARMFQSMRVRGQTGGFMLDAISGVDIALWDLAGQWHGRSVAALLGAKKAAVPAYLSGLAGATLADRIAFARHYFDQGFRSFKVFYDASPESLLATLDALRQELGGAARLAVDALWRLEWPASRGLIDALAERNLLWLEAPFMPDAVQAHLDLAAALPSLPLALGESYRTRREMGWFLERGLVQFVQPDLGRSGITETLRIAQAGVAVVPHVSVALGPQIAAAIHTAAAVSPLCEFNPTVFEMCNRFLLPPLAISGSFYQVSTTPGLGIDVPLDRFAGI